MTDDAPHKTWWTVAEIAAAALPDMPASERGVAKLAERQSWRGAPGCVRRRAGKGGGLIYHCSLFPPRARDHLAGMAIAAAPTEDIRRRTERWAAFEALPEAAKTKARLRADAVAAVIELERVGQRRSYAVDRVAASKGVGARSLWNWLGKVERAARDDWPPLLAGRHRAAERACDVAEISPEAWDVFKADYLRLEAPALTASYRRTRRIAAKNGWALPSEQTMRRLVQSRISKDVLTLARMGVQALKQRTPPQIRDKSMLHAMHSLDADFHKFDVFVEWAPGHIIRPQLCAIHDIYSGMIVGWRMAETPNSVTVMLTIGDVIEDFGIPTDVFIDNGREFAAKWITGGIKNRFRFKIKDDDPLGVLPQLGVGVHFTTPYAGQSKPIERSFRDLCEDVAKDPRFKGAYVGSRPDRKPENYGSRAVSRDEFMRVVAEGIAEFNAREGRRTPVARGRSFGDVFATSYGAAPIRKATREQARLWLLGSQPLTAHRTHGELSFQGNKYWADWCKDIAGRKVVARFDPEDLHAGLHVYAKDGAYLGLAECREGVGFADLEGAKDVARQRSRLLRATRDQLRAQVALTDAQHRQLLDGAAPGPSIDIEAKIVAPDFKRKAPAGTMEPPAPMPARAMTEEEEAAHRQVVVQLSRPKAASAPVETEKDRFRRALALIERINAGDPVGEGEANWLRSYRTSAEFKGLETLHAAWGEAMFAE